MVLIMSSGCSTMAQSCYTDYEEIYYDYVINGVITHPEFVNDGTYSYHIIGHYPTNVYWELIPYGEVYLFNTSMVKISIFVHPQRYIYYNHTLYHRYYPDRRWCEHHHIHYRERYKPHHGHHNHHNHGVSNGHGHRRPMVGNGGRRPNINNPSSRPHNNHSRPNVDQHRRPNINNQSFRPHDNHSRPNVDQHRRPNGNNQSSRPSQNSGGRRH